MTYMGKESKIESVCVCVCVCVQVDSFAIYLIRNIINQLYPNKNFLKIGPGTKEVFNKF